MQPGRLALQVGKGRIAPEKLSISITAGMQLTVYAEIVSHNRSIRYVPQSQS